MLNQSATLLKFPLKDAYQAHLESTFQDLFHTLRDETMFGQGYTLFVSFSIDATQWKIVQRMGHLGGLYGIDLSNYLSRQGILKQYAVPSVDDKARASKGLKRIHVTYSLERIQ